MWSAKSTAGHREQLSQPFSLNLNGNMKESKGRGEIWQRRTKRLFQKRKDVRKAIENIEAHEGKRKLSLTKGHKERKSEEREFSSLRKRLTSMEELPSKSQKSAIPARLERWPMHWIPSQRQYLGCRFDPWPGWYACRRQLIAVSLHSSLPSPVSKNKRKIILWL